jgi:hypothetical protein
VLRRKFRRITGIDPSDGEAVMKWQAARGLPATGKIRRSTLDKAREEQADKKLLTPDWDGEPSGHHSSGGDMALMEPNWGGEPAGHHAAAERGHADDTRLLEPDFGEAPKKPAHTKVSKPAGHAAAGHGDILKDGELILSRKPSEANKEHLATFRAHVGSKIKSWGLPFDEHSVRIATAPASVSATGKHARSQVVAMEWQSAWGTKPSTHELQSLRPVDAKAAVTGVHGLSGWAKLAADDRDVLGNLLGGETNDLSNSARSFLRPKFAGLRSKSDAEQGKTLKGVIGNKDASPSVVAEQVDVKPVDVSLAGPIEKRGFAFSGKNADAESWTATYSDGASFEIVAPKAPEPGLHNHSVSQAADAARYLPASSRKLIKRVMLNAVTNPDDPHWAAEYHEADFHSYMTAGASGTVTIYPDKRTKALPDDNYMRGTMIHETGHTWSYQNWGRDETKGKWVDWKKAMDADRVSVSGYAKAAIAEDVAETVQVYGSTKGKPKFEEYKRMVPHRFAILEKELK